MKYLTLFPVIIIFCACNETGNTQKLQNRIDSLQTGLANTYKPGFGEFMSSIQIHHAKLWFAGQNENWKLADFEVNEIKESLDGIKKYCADRSETKSIGMIDQPVENLNKAISQKNAALFKDNFIILTSTCNSCHQTTNHEFNVIKIPDNPPFSNQDFKPHEK